MWYDLKYVKVIYSMIEISMCINNCWFVFLIILKDIFCMLMYVGKLFYCNVCCVDRYYTYILIINIIIV